VRPPRLLHPSRKLTAGTALLVTTTVVTMAGAKFGADPFRPSAATLQAPSLHHLMGTDQVGRDVLTRVTQGAGTSLWVAAASALASALIGTTAGLLAGYTGGLLDDAVLKLAEIAQVMPQFLVALVAGALFGSSRFVLIAILALTFWPSTARLTRGETLSLRELDFVEAAKAQGASKARILFHHILPGALPVIITNTSFQAGAAILIEAGLAFLGLGDRNVVSWGAMLADAQNYVGIAWWLSLFPGLGVSLTVIGMNLAGDGLNDTLGR